MTRVFRTSIFVLVCCSWLAPKGFSQEGSKRPRYELQVNAGWAGFHNDSWTHNGLAAISFQRRLSSHFLMGSEVAFMGTQDPNDTRKLTTNTMLIYEIGSSMKIRPYLLGGAGLRNEHEQIDAGLRWVRHGTAGGGAGVKLAISRHFYIAPEVRFGWEPAARSTVGIGYRF
jgi:hypothetical protein